MNTINIEGLDKAEVLASLYNSSKPLGLGILHFKNEDMGVKEAKELLQENTYFDYLHGRVMKVDLKGTDIRVGMYDRDNGEGAFASVISSLRENK